MYSLFHTLDALIGSLQEHEKLQKTLRSVFEERFGTIIECTGTFVLERDYIESEWRDSVELYYGLSHYRLEGTLYRIHFVSEWIVSFDEISSDNYLGYITYRPVPVPQVSVSRIRLRWMKSQFLSLEEAAQSRLYVLAVETVVNFPHTRIHYLSFPIYAQDAMVAVCAHADMLMIAKYMYKKFNFNHYRLKEMVGNNPLGWNTNARAVPSEGLTITQMLEILSQNRYNPTALLFRNGRYNDMSIIDYIDSFLESALPVILAFRQHVILVVGHLCDDQTSRHYIIADDSTYHLAGVFEGSKTHLDAVEAGRLNVILAQHDVYVITPSFDRFYFQYPYVQMQVRKIVEFLGRNASYSIKSREILVDSGTLKRFLYIHGDKSLAEVSMPHYVWYVEFYKGEKSVESLYAYTVLDATAHKYDHACVIRGSGGSVEPVRTVPKGLPQLSLLERIEEELCKR
jgi:hypothetical protein